VQCGDSTVSHSEQNSVVILSPAVVRGDAGRICRLRLHRISDGADHHLFSRRTDSSVRVYPQWWRNEGCNKCVRA